MNIFRAFLVNHQLLHEHIKYGKVNFDIQSKKKGKWNLMYYKPKLKYLHSHLVFRSCFLKHIFKTMVFSRLGWTN